MNFDTCRSICLPAAGAGPIFADLKDPFRRATILRHHHRPPPPRRQLFGPLTTPIQSGNKSPGGGGNMVADFTANLALTFCRHRPNPIPTLLFTLTCTSEKNCPDSDMGQTKNNPLTVI